jgi:asparagine synthase (glutamine-hydrolysing)
MTAAIAHRGPDDEGFYFEGTLGLGFRRLSIIDLAGGHQPMSDPEGAIQVLFNGEIYNFPELRHELESRGYIFRTRSDTEVIVHGYRYWGLDVLNHLNGMFGLAIWDVRKRRLMLARDRMGIKFVYYKLDESGIRFGSEIRAILATESHSPCIDPTAINLFLRYRYTPSPFTAFKGIKKLAPGSRLIVEDGSVRIERWWRSAPEPFDPMPAPKLAAEQLLEIYRRAIKRHLISDVPVGLLLSGGIDSGLLLALMMENGSNWQTYTVGFGSDFRNDELIKAAETARVFGVPNYPVQLDELSFNQTLSHILTTVEEPIATTSVVPMYHVTLRARQDVKVALVGQGPDELFGGYNRHLGLSLGPTWRALPEFLRSSLRAVLATLPRNYTIKRALYSLDVPERMHRYQQVFSLLPGPCIDELFQDSVCPPDAGEQILECWADLEPLLEKTDELGGFQFLEIRSSLPDELLLCADKLSMMHGLEVRVPFLDVEIVEFAERLALSYKVRHGKRKWLHRQVCSQYLPESIVRRRKLGFATPIDSWFQKSVGGKLDENLLDPQSQLYEFLEREPIKMMIDEHRRGRSDHQKILFSLVLLEDWLRGYDPVSRPVSGTMTACVGTGH